MNFIFIRLFFHANVPFIVVIPFSTNEVHKHDKFFITQKKKFLQNAHGLSSLTAFQLNNWQKRIILKFLLLLLLTKDEDRTKMGNRKKFVLFIFCNIYKEERKVEDYDKFLMIDFFYLEFWSKNSLSKKRRIVIVILTPTNVSNKIHSVI